MLFLSSFFWFYLGGSSGWYLIRSHAAVLVLFHPVGAVYNCPCPSPWLLSYFVCVSTVYSSWIGIYSRQTFCCRPMYCWEDLHVKWLLASISLRNITAIWVRERERDNYCDRDQTDDGDSANKAHTAEWNESRVCPSAAMESWNLFGWMAAEGLIRWRNWNRWRGGSFVSRLLPII